MSVKARFEDSDEEVEIGQIELWYMDGSRAVDNGLDIADVCDSLGQVEADYAAAVCTVGTVDAFIVDGAFSNDVLVIHSLELSAEWQGQETEARIIREIGQTIGYHCAAVVLIPERVGITDGDEIELVPTKNPSIFALGATRASTYSVSPSKSRQISSA